MDIRQAISRETRVLRRLRVVFMGSGREACPTLDAIMRDPALVAAGIVTQPDRPQKRNLRQQPCAVKHYLGTRDVPVWTPENINSADALDVIRHAAPDVMVVMSYGQFLGDALLALPPLGCVNVHLSLLPAYRGAAPVQWAIANGESVSGITVMRMSRRMDAGGIFAQERVPVLPSDTAMTLGTRLAGAAPGILLSVLARLAGGDAVATPQDEDAATFAPRLSKSDGRIDWTQPAEIIERRIRAFTPWPGCFCHAGARETRRLRVLRAAIEPAPPSGSANGVLPGTVIDINESGPLIATGRQALRLLEVQPEGKRPMPGHAYLCGHAVKPGERMQ